MPNLTASSQRDKKEERNKKQISFISQLVVNRLSLCHLVMANIITQVSNYLLLLFLTMMKSMAKKMQDSVTKAIFGSEQVTAIASFYEIVDKDMKGKDVPMSSYKDNVLLVVNVASQ